MIKDRLREFLFVIVTIGLSLGVSGTVNTFSNTPVDLKAGKYIARLKPSRLLNLRLSTSLLEIINCLKQSIILFQTVLNVTNYSILT